MSLLQAVDQPSSDIEAYIKNVDAVLLQKIEMISSVRGKLIKFYQNIKKEEALQKVYQQNVQQQSSVQDQTEFGYGCEDENMMDES